MKGASNYLFVYGTLMKGFSNDFAKKLHSFSVLVGNATFPGRLYTVSWYPGAIHLPTASTRVHGEVYRLPSLPDLLPELDEYEDIYDDENLSLYIRRSIPVQMENGPILNCWVYLYNQVLTDLKVIDSGDFRKLS
jgi:gamma-glutamylcyclotransferase (GGCT)/AIG2-like uncharacterized protein YtfP